jgi:hypothetical protein
LAIAALLCALAALARGAEDGPAPGEPYPSGPQTIPYEDVLDHCDLLLVGKITGGLKTTVELEVTEVLKGELADKSVKISYKGSWVSSQMDCERPPKIGTVGAFFCLRADDGTLRLAGYPPKGGGYVEEGPELARKLLEAARDPAAGFAAEDPSVRLSAAYRLARAWLAAPDDARPETPAGLVKVLVAGLSPDARRGRHVNAAARNAVNGLLDCNLIDIWRYSVNHSDARRGAVAKVVAQSWEQTLAALRARRREGNGGLDQQSRRAAELVRQLGSDDYQLREKADRQLREMGAAALPAVRSGTGSADPEVADRCEKIVAALTSSKKLPRIFDLDRAALFVPERAPVKEKAKRPGE